MWALNLLFVVLPANDYFGSFAATARSFSAYAVGGPTLPDFVASGAELFAAIIATVTAYLAAAFLLGATTRPACLIGAVFNGLLLITQVGQVWTFPGGTDVGPQPLYLIAYAALLLGPPVGPPSVDHYLRSRSVRSAHGEPHPIGRTPAS
ncbi:MAG TPA: hypothetical protein VFF67_01560 [Thermoplasmata archaeon]|nr:hypothetical protein [Thermoplasmata archaeon]